jgi:hypothetical protein
MRLVQTRQAIALYLVNVLTLRLPSAVRIALCDRLVDDVGEALGLVFENQPNWGGICVACGRVVHVRDIRYVLATGIRWGVVHATGEARLVLV